MPEAEEDEVGFPTNPTGGVCRVRMAELAEGRDGQSWAGELAASMY